MVDLTPVLIMGVIFAGIIGIVWVGSRNNIAKLKAKAQLEGSNPEVAKEISILRKENKDLRRRIETLEAIVVDSDMQLMTGLDSDLELRERSRKKRADSDKDISI